MGKEAGDGGLSQAEVDALIATHAADDDAHHAKYTNAEADARAAALIAVHAALATVHQDAPALIATHAAVGDVHALGGNIVIMPLAYSSIGQGTWVVSVDASYWRQGVLYNSSNANGDNISYLVYLPKGTYTLWLLAAVYTHQGIVDIDIDGDEVASFDLYGSQVYNQVFSQASIAISTTGLYTLKVRIDGKNGSSTGYYINFQNIVLWRTA